MNLLQNFAQRRITMDLNHSNTDTDSRKHGQHLSLAERGAIRALQRQNLPLRAIAAQVGCVNILAQGNRQSGRRKPFT